MHDYQLRCKEINSQSDNYFTKKRKRHMILISHLLELNNYASLDTLRQSFCIIFFKGVVHPIRKIHPHVTLDLY